MGFDTTMKVISSSDGAPVPKTIDYTPGANDVTYTESGGVLSGTNGIFNGWNAANWGLTNSLVESDANNNIVWSADIDALGQMYAYYYQNWMDVVPQIYKDVYGDFSITVKMKSIGSNDTQRSPAIFFGRLDDDGTWNACLSMELKGWATTTFEPTYGARFHTTGKLYTGGAVDVVYLRLSRSGKQIVMEDSSDGTSWTTRVDRSIDAGNVGRLGFGFGGQGGTDVKCQIERLKASFYEYSP